MTRRKPPDWAVAEAIEAAKRSPCAKSRRGVSIYSLGDVEIADSIGWNHPPEPFFCDGSLLCREACNKTCIHAESHALRRLDGTAYPEEYFLVHVKIDVDGKLVAGGVPSCWQCSREIAEAKLGGVWLYIDFPPPPQDRDPTWVLYGTAEFHKTTLCNVGLPSAALRVR
jgi:hypothetical protein